MVDHRHEQIARNISQVLGLLTASHLLANSIGDNELAKSIDKVDAQAYRLLINLKALTRPNSKVGINKG